MPELTIITPTYNRAECLKLCCESLEKQTNKDFQWLIVDDGSSDHTADVVKAFMKRFLKIDYIYKENGGKHTALNASHPYIKGNYVLILDSDDTLIPEAVDTVLTLCKKYENNPEVGQFIFLKGYSEDKPICYVAHEDVVVDTLKETRISNTGRDCCDVYRTELFKKHPFPEFEGERFIGEGAAFLGIELESKGVYQNKVIYICDYLEDGLTKAGRKMRIQNPKGGMYNSRLYMNRRLPLKTRIKKGILYNCYSGFCEISIVQSIKESDYKGLAIITCIPGRLLCIYWRKKYLK